MTSSAAEGPVSRSSSASASSSSSSSGRSSTRCPIFPPIKRIFSKGTVRMNCSICPGRMRVCLSGLCRAEMSLASILLGATPIEAMYFNSSRRRALSDFASWQPFQIRSSPSLICTVSMGDASDLEFSTLTSSPRPSHFSKAAFKYSKS